MEEEPGQIEISKEVATEIIQIVLDQGVDSEMVSRSGYILKVETIELWILPEYWSE